MPTSRGGMAPVAATDQSLSGVLAGRLDAIGGDATVQRLLHGLAMDMVGPVEQLDLPAAEYEWIEGAIADAVQAAGDQRTGHSDRVRRPAQGGAGDVSRTRSAKPATSSRIR